MMVPTRLNPWPVRSRLPAGLRFGECLQRQRPNQLDANRRISVGVEYELSTLSGDRRTRSPA